MYVKNKMRGQRFSLPEEAVVVFTMHVLEIPHSEWQKCFENWFKRMQKCIDLNGKYFEKQLSDFPKYKNKKEYLKFH